MPEGVFLLGITGNGLCREVLSFEIYEKSNISIVGIVPFVWIYKRKNTPFC